MSKAEMTCGRARRLLWPDQGPRPASPSVIEAQAHVASCAACQEFIADMRALGDTIRESAPREQAPAEVRERLFAAVARARAGSESRGRRFSGNWRLLAASILLIVVGATVLADRLPPGATSDPLAALAADHARAVGEAHLVSADPTEVKGWLAQRVHFGMQVPVLPGASLRGARISVFDGRRAAVLEYDVAGTPMSYFVIPNEAPSGEDGGAMRFAQAAHGGYLVVSWREPGLLHAMVGNLSASQLVTLAKACVEQAGRAVA